MSLLYDPVTVQAPMSTAALRSERDRRVRCFDVTASRFGTSRAAVLANRTGAMQIMSHSELELLLQADRFRSVDAQAAHVGRHPASAGHDVGGLIEAWLASGFLTRAADVRDELDGLSTAEEPMHARIASVGVPTRNRNGQVVGALHALLSNTQAHGRSPRVLVADGSSVHHQLRLRLELERLRARYDARIDHLDDAWRAGLILRVLDETNCRAETMRFALYGDERCRSNYGANRNALLLATAGEMTVQVDDDVRLPVLRSPAAEPGLALRSVIDPNEYWFDVKEAPLESAHDIDFLGLHETLLGRPAGSLTCGSLAVIDDLDADLLRAIQDPDAAVGATMVGHRGDAGAASNASRLFLRGASLRRLIQSRYADRIRTRNLIRCVPQRTIGTSRFCVAMNLGLDHRLTLPPFMPVGRNEDGVFSAVLHACLPALLRGFPEGYVVRHEPSDERRPYEASTRFHGFRVNDLMTLLVDELSMTPPAGRRWDVHGLGSQLVQIGMMDEPQFELHCRLAARRALGRIAQEVELRLESRPGSDLERDLIEYGHSVEAWTVSMECDVPADLPGLPQERRAHFRELVRAYGELLTHWSDIVRVANIARIGRDGH